MRPFTKQMPGIGGHGSPGSFGLHHQSWVRAVIAGLTLALGSMSAAVAAVPTVSTDKPDYLPGEVVTITGSSFDADTTYQVPVIRPDGSLVKGDAVTPGYDSVTSDGSGAFTYLYDLDGIVGTYEARVYPVGWAGDLGQTPLASTTFTDGPCGVDVRKEVVLTPGSSDVLAGPGTDKFKFDTTGFNTSPDNFETNRQSNNPNSVDPNECRASGDVVTTITEEDPSSDPGGYTLDRIECELDKNNNAANPATWVIDNGARQVTVTFPPTPANENNLVNCTFYNLADAPPADTGTITIEKQTVPDGDPTTFEFTGDPNGFVADGETITSIVTPGTYQSTEIVPAGWVLTDIACDDDDSSGNIESATATFEVAKDEAVKCTFTNTRTEPVPLSGGLGLGLLLLTLLGFGASELRRAPRRLSRG